MLDYIWFMTYRHGRASHGRSTSKNFKHHYVLIPNTSTVLEHMIIFYIYDFRNIDFIVVRSGDLMSIAWYKKKTRIVWFLNHVAVLNFRHQESGAFLTRLWRMPNLLQRFSWSQAMLLELEGEFGNLFARKLEKLQS